MKLTKLIAAVFILCITISCEKDDTVGFNDNNGAIPTLTTNAPTDIFGTAVVLGGTVTSEGSSTVVSRGVCWSLNANPTLSDRSQSSDGSGLGTFSVSVNGLEANTTYHVRAYASNNYSDVAYGNNITFTTGDIVNFITDIPRNIITTRVDLNATISDAPGVSVSSRGFVIDTAVNPTIDDVSIDGGYGTGEYGGQISNLNPNTTYYARPYARVNGEYVYGVEQSFRTTGYFGPASGYVVFDKGETTEGWRYLEASPQQSNFNNVWGCRDTFISNTYEDVGTGWSNTGQITSNCNASSFAAKTAFNYSYNGYSDWFLPSRLEAIITMRSLSDLNALTNVYHWTSTEVNATNAYYILYSSGSGNITSHSSSKNNTFTYLPIRKY